VQIDLEQLYRCLQKVPDRREWRGRRCPLAASLMICVLAKLAGQAMAHDSTWSRLLGQGVSPKKVEQALGQFVAGEKRSKVPKRGSIQMCLDGKRLREPILAGQSHGVHLMAT